ncbi:MAG TPA: DNA alkylation repair protein [Caulobacteraceae bacterium]|jgi:3-methyladenine DNA glycosylase AlkD|nr:DNA alkylation repair protein [Caulobacteraceae bacterium]
MAEALDIAAEHAGLVAQLRAAGTPYRGGHQNDSYTGSGHPFFNVSAPALRRIGRTWLAGRRKAGDADLLAVVERLFVGEAYEEKVLAAVILALNARMRRLGTPTLADGWLDHLQGWAEIDSLCASVFGPDEMAADWPAWRDLIRRLTRDANINRRRAALVLLCRPTRLSPDPRYRELAFEVVERLKAERPILITKAVSWLLRSMAGHHGAAVAAYLDANAATLPAVAVRETRTKLRTGTKSGRSQAK